jgi:antitoxin VapB
LCNQPLSPITASRLYPGNAEWEMENRESLRLTERELSIYLKHILYEVMKMKTAKLFQNGQSQAVRLPKEFRFEGDAVFIKKSGSAVVLIPLVNSWDSLIGSLDKFTKDYMADRDQPKQQKREAVFE